MLRLVKNLANVYYKSRSAKRLIDFNVYFNPLTNEKQKNKRVANIATNNVNPPVYITTEVISIENDNDSKILVIKKLYKLKELF